MSCFGAPGAIKGIFPVKMYLIPMDGNIF